jgi:peptidyl-prolyl cis-trans isomerase C
VATVNGEAISQAMYRIYAQQRQVQSDSLDKPQVREALTNELVTQALLVQEAEKQQLGSDPELELQLAMIRRNLLATTLLRKVVAATPPDEAAIAQQYEKTVATLGETKEYHVRHILTASEEAAVTATTELKGGADFTEVAKTRSEDSSGAEGGDLDWLNSDTLEQIAPEFAEAVSGLEKGRYTEKPVETRFGWHVILVEDVRDAAPPSLEELRPEIEQELQTQTVNEYLTKLREGARIDIK